MEFRWIEWNRAKLAIHGVGLEEAEAVVQGARRPYPQNREDDKWVVRGRGRGGRLLQVIYLIDPDDSVFVIHARPLTPNETRRWRKEMNP